MLISIQKVRKVGYEKVRVATRCAVESIHSQKIVAIRNKQTD